jgi:hypothetical protein
VDSVSDKLLLLRKSISAGNRTGTPGSVAGKLPKNKMLWGSIVVDADEQEIIFYQQEAAFYFLDYYQRKLLVFHRSLISWFNPCNSINAYREPCVISWEH